MTLDEIFKEDVTRQKVEGWWEQTDGLDMWYELIKLTATGFEKLEKQLEDLQRKSVLTAEGHQLKVGWVYKNGYDDEILIVKKGNMEPNYPLIGVRIVNPRDSSSYTSKGYYSQYDSLDSANLIPSTGKKWEIEE
jgi:hypothetical protein